MGISQYIKVIGRGKDGARALTREQAADLFGQVLDGTVSDLEVGGFCLAMRIKGETPDEMAGFLDATHSRLKRISMQGPAVVLPSYNGARRLPVLTPLLGMLLARRGASVLIHGTATETSRVFVPDVLQALSLPSNSAIESIASSAMAHVATEHLHPGLKRLLDVRRAVGLRNSSHSLVKLMNPCTGPAVVVGSYTHPEYAVSMAAVFELVGATAMLLRGTEGEPAADPRRLPQMEGFVVGKRHLLDAGQKGTITDMPDLPKAIDADTTAAYIRDVLDERKPVPQSIALQVEHILRLAAA